jgi:hypothetical protein
MDFLGNISLRLVGLLVTVGIMAAAYFFFVRPATDTASKAFDSISRPLKQAQQRAARAEEHLQQGSKTGTPGAQVDLVRLQRCVRKAHRDVNRLQRCANRFGP